MLLKIIRLIRDRTPGIGHESDWLVTNLLPVNFWQMVVRQLKLQEELIKPGPWRMKT